MVGTAHPFWPFFPTIFNSSVFKKWWRRCSFYRDNILLFALMISFIWLTTLVVLDGQIWPNLTEIVMRKGHGWFSGIWADLVKFGPDPGRGTDLGLEVFLLSQVGLMLTNLEKSRAVVLKSTKFWVKKGLFLPIFGHFRWFQKCGYAARFGIPIWPKIGQFFQKLAIFEKRGQTFSRDPISWIAFFPLF